MKILIADDEDYTREGIIEAIDWEKYEIDEIMQAVNGVEADKIARWFVPDIIITDIRMPQMDGIEFANRIFERNPDCRIIFISGYMEIEYLKSAIQLQAIDFIEKPIEPRVVEKALEKAVDEIKRRQQSQENAQNQMELQQQKLFRLLTSKQADENTMKRLAKETGVSLNQNFQCIIGSFKGCSSETVHENLVAMRLCLQETSFVFLENENAEKKQYEYIVSYPAKEQYRLTPLYQRMLDKVPTLRLGVGIEAGDYHGVYNSYRTAAAAINCAFYQEQERLFFIDEQIMQKGFIEPGLYGEFLQIISGQPSDIMQWFDDLFEQLINYKYYYREQVVTLLVSLLTAVYKKYPLLYESCPEIHEEEQIQTVLMQMESLMDIRTLFGSILSELKDNEEESRYSRLIRGVMDYVEAHYMEESLSVSEIAGHLHMSPAYLNVLFKQERKMTLKQYVSYYRLERAKKLLENDFYKITEIAEKCGYANSNYFAKVFREAMNMTPAEYRKEKGQL